MANKARGYGLSAELEKKKASKFDPVLANEAMDWIRDVLRHENPSDPDIAKIGEVQVMDDVTGILKDGVILCKVMNAMYPGTIRKINTNKMAFKQMENVGNFLTGCVDKAGCHKSDMFQTVDLYEGSNIPLVINGIHALGRKAHECSNGIPALGPQEAQENKREFTEEQLASGKNVIGLQMGTNKMASQAGQNFGKTRAIID